jgi:hypothetical protein
VISNNVFYANSTNDDWGGVIYLESAPDFLIQGNTIVGNQSEIGKGCGVTSLFAQGGTIINNIVAFNGPGYGIKVAVPNAPPAAVYNDTWLNESGDFYGITPGEGSIFADPLLCDTQSLDFELAQNSPCLGAGEACADIGALGVGCEFPSPEQPHVLNLGIGLPGDSLHITNHTPTISWAYFDSQGRPLTGSEIEVGIDDDWTMAEMWQPPTIESDDTTIVYAGSTLGDGNTYYVRVRVFNDTLWSLWLAAPFRMNSQPTAPTLAEPLDGEIASTGRPTLILINSSDAEGDALRYDFEIHLDSSMSLLTEYISGVYEGSGQTDWTTDSLVNENRPHWWWARASDGYENGPWSDTRMFWVNAYNEPPLSFELESPADTEDVYVLRPEFIWAASPDPDPEDSTLYALIIGLDPNFTFYSQTDSISTTSHTLTNDLELETDYWWKVKAADTEGAHAWSNNVFRFLVTTPWICGDADGSDEIDIDDIVYLVNYIFSSGSPPDPLESGDADCSTAVDIDDVVWLIAYIFSGGNAPCDTNGDTVPDC